MPDDEVLVIRGRLDRAGRYTPGRSRSTKIVHQWPEVDESDYLVELLDAKDEVLHREPALVTPEIDCEPGAPQMFRLLAYIGLRADAESVRLRHADIVLWRAEIPEAAEITASLRRARPTREKPLELMLRYSEPGDGAHVTVIYQWGERRFRPLYIGPPAERIEIDLADLPGGDECRLVVSYSNGLRSAGDATKSFRLPLVGPVLVIEQPQERAVAVAGTPIVLEGHVADPERPGGARPDEHLAWYVDGEEAGRGPLTSVDALDAGTHEVALVYEGDPGARVVRQLRVRRPKVPTANDWPAWDPTDDDVSAPWEPEPTDRPEAT